MKTRILFIICILSLANFAKAQVPTLLLSTQTVDKNNGPLDSTIFSYNEEDQLRTEIYEYYSSTQKKWIKSRRTFHTYTDDGDLEETLIRSFDGSEYKNLLKYAYYYASKGKKDSMITFSWKDGEWVTVQRDIYTLNSKGMIEQAMVVKLEDGKLEPYEKQLFSYDAQDRIAKKAIHRWDATSSDYKEKIEWIYDYWNGKLEKESRREKLGVDWYNVDYFYYTYTSFGEIKQRARYIASTNEINDTKLYRYNKEDQSSSTSEVQDFLNVRVYPNPAQNFVVFDLKNDIHQLTILDTKGQHIWQQNNQSGAVQIPVLDWSKGVYYFQITNQSGAVQNGKFFIQ